MVHFYSYVWSHEIQKDKESFKVSLKYKNNNNQEGPLLPLFCNGYNNLVFI